MRLASSQLKIVEYLSKCDILFSSNAVFDIIVWQLTKIVFNVFAYNIKVHVLFHQFILLHLL
jgi:hypothetical protein